MAVTVTTERSYLRVTWTESLAAGASATRVELLDPANYPERMRLRPIRWYYRRTSGTGTGVSLSFAALASGVFPSYAGSANGWDIYSASITTTVAGAKVAETEVIPPGWQLVGTVTNSDTLNAQDVEVTVVVETGLSLD